MQQEQLNAVCLRSNITNVTKIVKDLKDISGISSGLQSEEKKTL